MKEDEDVQKADLEHCGLFLSWLRLLRTVCKQCTNYFQAAQPHRTTCLNSSPADSHPLKESLFQDVFDVQSFKCEIEFPLGFLSSCASGSPLCALVCSPVDCAYCWPVSWERSRTQCLQAVWLKRLLPIKTGSKHLKKTGKHSDPRWTLVAHVHNSYWQQEAGQDFDKGWNMLFSSSVLNLGTELLFLKPV